MNYAESIEWVKGQVKSIGLGFHPDTAYADYIDKNTGKPLFTADEASALQAKLDEAFEVLGTELYEVAYDAMKEVWDEADED